MRYQNWLNEWLECYEKPTVKTRTYEKYKKLIQNHICHTLGGYELHELTTDVLQRFIGTLSENGYAPNTINGILSVIKLSLRKAVLLGGTEKQFADNVQCPKMREKNIECFSEEEQQKIEKYIFGNKKIKLSGIILCLYSGLRIGELLALTWDDIDLKKGYLSVTRTCRDSWKNGSYIKITDTPKTQCSQRIIPLPGQLLPYLKTIKKSDRGNYFVCGRSKYGAQVRSYQKTFERLLRKLKIPHRGFHSLRHTFATRALESGMDVKTLSEILGHKNPTVTLSRYAHSLMKHKTEMMNRLGTHLKL